MLDDKYKEQSEKLLKLVHDAVNQDQELREKYQVGDKFRFIRDRLTALLQRVEENLQALQKQAEKKSDEITEDETVVYVYLFNAQGLVLHTWLKMLNPSVFYEYSVNRPIYLDKALIESFIRSRSSMNQHGYITIRIKRIDILSSMSGEAAKDAIGNPIIKVKEGCLHVNKVVCFTHNGHDYVLENGVLVKKKVD